jgi:hypothetical protein
MAGKKVVKEDDREYGVLAQIVVTVTIPVFADSFTQAAEIASKFKATAFVKANNKDEAFDDFEDPKILSIYKE